ncbi:MAG TPA: hypothetical protein VFF69_07845 [Phycisphaerales bacterium]|nr:hypothetical protein [Phycisphaerales bacterium]
MHENEHAAAAAQQAVEQAFLSPRVVDAATLAEFGESMRELIRHAAEQRELLRLTLAESGTVSATLREASAQATEKLRPAAKLVPTIDHKLAQAEQALARAAQAIEAAERAAGQAAKTAADEGVAAVRGAHRALDEAMERARGLEARLGRLTDGAESAVQRLETECKSRLEGAARHAHDLLGTIVGELDSRAEQAIHRLSALVDERRAAAEAALGAPLSIGGARSDAPQPADVDQAAEAATLLGHAQEARAEIETLFASLKSRARAEITSLEAEAIDAEQRAAHAAAKVHETEELARAAEARLSAVRRELAAVDDRGREIATMASQALAAFDQELSARMHAVREMMEQLASVTNGAPHAPPANAALAATEVKPPRDAAFVRIDRPMHGDSPGLPGRLRI